MLLYHRTDQAEAIVAEGFRDHEGYYLTDRRWRGVWFSDVVLDVSEGASGDTVLVVDVPHDVAAPYEWIEEGKPYREFLIPADVANRYGRPRVVSRENDKSL